MFKFVLKSADYSRFCDRCAQSIRVNLPIHLTDHSLLKPSICQLKKNTTNADHLSRNQLITSVHAPLPLQPLIFRNGRCSLDKPPAITARLTGERLLASFDETKTVFSVIPVTSTSNNVLQIKGRRGKRKGAVCSYASWNAILRACQSRINADKRATLVGRLVSPRWTA